MEDRVALLAALCGVCFACGGVWWKAGAGVAELARDQQVCEGAGARDSREFEGCMREKSWWYSGFDAEPQAEEARAPRPADRTAAPAAVDSSLREKAADAELPPVDAAPAAEPVRNRNLWWKLGGSVDRLASDQSECRKRSGLAPTADESIGWGQSAAFDRCMLERGWRGGPR